MKSEALAVCRGGTDPDALRFDVPPEKAFVCGISEVREILVQPRSFGDGNFQDVNFS